jgi:hypothetical protein
VWATESVFVHVTVSPASTSKSSGENARFARVAAPEGMVTADDGAPEIGNGADEGDVGADK